MLDYRMSRAKAPIARVNYASHLLASSLADVRSWVNERWGLATALAAGVFFGTALATCFVRRGQTEFVAPFLMGMAAVSFLGGILFTVHFLYLTPRKLCATKQSQLDEERRKYAASLEVEVQRRREAVAERDQLKSKLEARFSDRAA